MNPDHLALLDAAREDPLALRILADQLAETADANAIGDVIESARWLWCDLVDQTWEQLLRKLPAGAGALARAFQLLDACAIDSPRELVGITRVELWRLAMRTRAELATTLHFDLDALDAWLVAHGLPPLPSGKNAPPLVNEVARFTVHPLPPGTRLQGRPCPAGHLVEFVHDGAVVPHASVLMADGDESQEVVLDGVRVRIQREPLQPGPQPQAFVQRVARAASTNQDDAVAGARRAAYRRLLALPPGHRLGRFAAPRYILRYPEPARREAWNQDDLRPLPGANVPGQPYPFTELPIGFVATPEQEAAFRAAMPTSSRGDRPGILLTHTEDRFAVGDSVFDSNNGRVGVILEGWRETLGQPYSRYLVGYPPTEDQCERSPTELEPVPGDPA